MDDKYEDRDCPVCGHTFRVRIGGRGRPREYDTEQCKRLRSRLEEVQGLLAWLRGDHGISNRAAGVLHSELSIAGNLINPRGGHKRDPDGRLTHRN